MRYAIRFDEKATLTRDGVKEVFRNKFDGSYVVTREIVNGENPHYHMVWDTDRTPQATRAYLKRALGLEGNAEYSCTQAKFFDSTLEYCLKGTEDEPADIVCYSGLDLGVDKVHDMRKTYWERQAKLAEDKRQLRQKIKKEDKFQVLMLQKAIEKKLTTTADVLDMVIDTLLEQDRVLNDHYIRMVVRFVMAKTSEIWKEGYKQSLLSGMQFEYHDRHNWGKYEKP